MNNIVVVFVVVAFCGNERLNLKLTIVIRRSNQSLIVVGIHSFFTSAFRSSSNRHVHYLSHFHNLSPRTPLFLLSFMITIYLVVHSSFVKHTHCIISVPKHHDVHMLCCVWPCSLSYYVGINLKSCRNIVVTNHRDGSCIVSWSIIYYCKRNCPIFVGEYRTWGEILCS